MTQVKRVEAYGLLADLKTFAFERSEGFRDNSQRAVDIVARYHHIDPIPAAVTHKLSKDICTSTLAFSATRLPSKRQKPAEDPLKSDKLGKPAYEFTLSTAVVRSLPVMTDVLLEQIPEKFIRKYGGFEELEEGALQERFKATYSTSDYELHTINVASSYKVTYLGKTMLRHKDEDLLFSDSYTPLEVPDQETDDGEGYIYVNSRPTEDRLSNVDSIVTAVQFKDVTTSLMSDRAVDSYRSAAFAMRGIVETLRTGRMD